MRRLALSSVILFVVGCGSQVSSSTRIAAPAHVGRPYQLYTHCGIEWAKIAGTFWRATHPLSDSSGNPPAGWGNPYQQGRLVILAPRTARFDSSAGSVTFKRTSRRQPPLLCS